MAIIDSILQRIATLEERVREHAASLVWFAKVSRSSGDGTTDGVEGHEDSQSYQYDAQRVEPWGLRSRPLTGIWGALIKAAAGAKNGILVGIATTAYGPTNLNAGETCLYCAKNATVKLDQDGAVTVTAQGGQTIVCDKNGGTTITSAAGQNIAVAPGAGGNVVLAGGVLKVARLTDQVTGTAGPWPIVGGVIATPGAPNVLG